MIETGSRFTHILEKRFAKVYSVSFNEFKLTTNKTLGCDMPQVKLKIMSCSFLD